MDKLKYFHHKLKGFSGPRGQDQFPSPKNLPMAFSAEISKFIGCFQDLTEKQSKNVSVTQFRAEQCVFSESQTNNIRLSVSFVVLELLIFLQMNHSPTYIVKIA
jgi:hypothetical protein